MEKEKGEQEDQKPAAEQTQGEPVAAAPPAWAVSLDNKLDKLEKRFEDLEADLFESDKEDPKPEPKSEPEPKPAPASETPKVENPEPETKEPKPKKQVRPKSKRRLRLFKRRT
jgi:hypothetical protein